MGGKVGLAGRLAIGALIVAAFLFGSARTVTADPGSYVVTIAAAADGPEGDAPGANSLTFPISISGPSPTPDDITVAYTSSEGLTPALTIPKGTVLPATVNFAVPINGNTTPENDRTMTVTLTGASFATDTTDTVAVGSPATATGTIVDDDWQIAGISSDPANATVSESGGTIDFQANLIGADGNAPPHHVISVDYTVADGTGAGGAVSGHDYQVTQPAGKKTGTLTFAPGTNVVHVKIQGINDNVYGLDKTFTVTLSNPKGASFAAGATVAETGTITEVSAPPVIAVNGCGAGSSSSSGTVTGGNDAVFALRTSYASPVPATVSWKTSDVSTANGDYDAGSGTATVPAGSRDASITIHTHENPPAGDRVFNVTISNPQHTTIVGGGNVASCTVHQPQTVGTDMLPSVQLTDPAPVPQPATGSVPVTISVTLNAPVTQPAKPAPVDLTWQTQDGTATAPADYSSASGTLHWDTGKFSTQTFNVQVNAATGTSNTAKKFTIAFHSPSAAFVGANVVNVTVVPPAAPPVMSVGDAAAAESSGSIPAVVSIAPSPSAAATVHYATADGTAKAGTDYTAVSGTITFQPGQTQKTVSIPIMNNQTPGPNLTFAFNLSAPTGGTLGTSTATMTIRNDDVAPAPPPVITQQTGPAPQQKVPTPLPQQQPKGNKHVVLVQVLTGQSTVDGKGYLHFMLKCPVPAVKSCEGTVVLQVRVAQKKAQGVKKDPPPTTVSVGAGSFKISVGKSVSVKVKVTKQGLALLEKYHRIKVKATVRAKDTQNVRGVTAWLVTVQEPARQITVKSPR
jgi:Calx-beta domain